MASLQSLLKLPIPQSPISRPAELSYPSQRSLSFAPFRSLSVHESRNTKRYLFKRGFRIRGSIADTTIRHTASDAPVLNRSEALESLGTFREINRENQKQIYLAMYSSVFGGITTDPAAMVIPMDDHMVHRGHGVFDNTTIVDGYLYDFDRHLDRILRAASMSKIKLSDSFDRERIRSILIQTASASKCRNGSLRYWLSAGPGDFLISSSGCYQPTFYAVVTQGKPPSGLKGVKVTTSSIPMKPPRFATMKSVNYLPNVLSILEAEEKGAYASIWLDSEGFIAEGPNVNVGFITSDKEFVMPRFDRILSGITAKRMLTLAERLVKQGRLRGIRSENLSVEEGKKADEMMLLGSGALVCPVLQWDDQIIGDGTEGPLVQALLDLLIEDMKSGPPSVRVPVPY